MALFCIRAASFWQPRPSPLPAVGYDWPGLIWSSRFLRGVMPYPLSPYRRVCGRQVCGAVQEWLATQGAGDVAGFAGGERGGLVIAHT
jgi:hypothetical protein